MSCVQVISEFVQLMRIPVVRK